MKTHTIKTPTAELMIVELPENSTFRELFGLIGADENNSPNYHLTEYKFSDYTLLGKPDEISEEDARKIVKQSIHTGLFAHYVKDIPVNIYCYKTATESLLSLLSLLESEIYWDVNPFGESEPELEAVCCGRSTEDNWGYPQCCGIATASEESVYLQSEWLEAEQKTFDRNRTLIFVKQ